MLQVSTTFTISISVAAYGGWEVRLSAPFRGQPPPPAIPYSSVLWSAPSAATSAAGPPVRVPEQSPLLPFRPAEKQVGCKRKQVGPCMNKVRPVYVFVCSGVSLISSAPAYGGWGARPSAPFRGQPPPPATRGARCYIPSPAYRDACSCTRCSRRCCRRAARG